ncbi:hypothetical protein [Nocardia pseudovaccinii]|uniref:hypothetical protein n=1 Tax=Nocardia pseudovaccinii TaxID=189540 RepID=UPI0012F497B2
MLDEVDTAARHGEFLQDRLGIRFDLVVDPLDLFRGKGGADQFANLGVAQCVHGDDGL